MFPLNLYYTYIRVQGTRNKSPKKGKQRFERVMIEMRFIKFFRLLPTQHSSSSVSSSSPSIAARIESSNMSSESPPVSNMANPARSLSAMNLPLAAMEERNVRNVYFKIIVMIEGRHRDLPKDVASSYEIMTSVLGSYTNG